MFKVEKIVERVKDKSLLEIQEKIEPVMKEIANSLRRLLKEKASQG